MPSCNSPLLGSNNNFCRACTFSSHRTPLSQQQIHQDRNQRRRPTFKPPPTGASPNDTSCSLCCTLQVAQPITNDAMAKASERGRTIASSTDCAFVFVKFPALLARWLRTPFLALRSKCVKKSAQGFTRRAECTNLAADRRQANIGTCLGK